MNHLSTHTVTPTAFTRQDFDESMELFRRVNKDLQGKHPEFDDELKAWITQWYPTLTVGYDPLLMVPEVTPSQYYIALPLDDAIVFSPPDDTKGATIMPWEHGHPLLLVAMSVIINLCQCDNFTEVWTIIRDLRGNSWVRRPVDMPRHIAVSVRHNFYQLLNQLITNDQEEKHED